MISSIGSLIQTYSPLDSSSPEGWARALQFITKPVDLRD